MMNELIFTNSPDAEVKRLLAGFAPARIMLLTDTHTRMLPDKYFSSLRGLPTVAIEAGEVHKEIVSLQHVWAAMAGVGMRRDSLLVNLGGGTVSDLGGFAAATYMRGISYINIPTTLLACVDASTGGKTAIDFCGIKNLVGAFHAPAATVVSAQPLATLPRTEILSGWAEMLKHALLDSCRHLDTLLESDPVDMVSSPKALSLIRSSVEVKQAVVERDPHEQGVRRCLNLGHTAGHALEALCMEQNRAITHGHAVALGMLAELSISVGFPPDILRCLSTHIRRLYPQVTITEHDADKLTHFMLKDKKNNGSSATEVSYIAMRSPGDCDIYASIDARVLASALVKLSGNIID